MTNGTIKFCPSLNRHVQELMDHLKRAGYSDGTCHIVLSYLRPIQAYMDKEEITEYSPAVGNAFLQHYFENSKAEGRRKNDISNTINMLNDCCDGGCHIVKKKSSNIYNESLGKYVNGLLELLSSLGYAEGTLRHYLSRLRPIQTYMSKKGISDYSPTVGDDYFEYYIRSRNTCIVEQKELRACIRRLNDFYYEKAYVTRHSKAALYIIPVGFQDAVDDFLNDPLIISNSKSTAGRRNRALSRFLNKCVRCNVSGPADFTPQAVLMSCGDVTDIDDWTTIRQFLRYLAVHDKTPYDFSVCVPKGSRRKEAPSTYSIEEIHSLEAAIDRSSRQGKRDYAVMLMADRLAIRAGDIASLKRENIDFNNGLISFMQTKTDADVRLPLVPELKEALEDYLADSPIDDAYVFHSLRAPYRPMTGSAVYALVDKYFKEANIDTSGKKHGPHSLRASVSTSMINDDVPYEAVRDILGHTSPNSIRRYAKNDIEKLRRCAIPVPAPAGSFRQFLQGGDRG